MIREHAFGDGSIKAATRELFRQADSGLWQLWTSVVTARELIRAPVEVRQVVCIGVQRSCANPRANNRSGIARTSLPRLCRGHAEIRGRRAACGNRHGPRPRGHRELELSPPGEPAREAAFNAVNLLQGYRQVRIVSPLEVIHDIDEDEEI